VDECIQTLVSGETIPEVMRGEGVGGVGIMGQASGTTIAGGFIGVGVEGTGTAGDGCSREAEAA